MTGVQGVILAGGISSRMGFPKALMPIGDSFFLRSIYDKLIGAGASPVHIVINTGLQTSLSAQMNKFAEGRFVLNREPGRGQLHSLQLGLTAAQEAEASAVVMALVDQPLVDQGTVKVLVERYAQEPGKLVLPVYEGKRGHPFIIPAAHFDAFIKADAAGGATARDVLDSLAASSVSVEVDDAGVCQDVDTPEDMGKLSLSADMD
ncbi:hypothetical protein CVU37_00875 [candidate division BRC1 bacterium HGW-BRC1-1]|jgi:CTP:molybdopterin cytidylyltransferase MocA|nr:MAG: hypothetical protein CVU37_00875 [candidate division BRC1 bacterium HGW-BRC1-1]